MSTPHPATRISCVHIEGEADLMELAAKIKATKGIILASEDPNEPRHGYIERGYRHEGFDDPCAICGEPFSGPATRFAIYLYDEPGISQLGVEMVVCKITPVLSESLKTLAKNASKRSVA